MSGERRDVVLKGVSDTYAAYNAKIKDTPGTCDRGKPLL